MGFGDKIPLGGFQKATQRFPRPYVALACLLLVVFIVILLCIVIFYSRDRKQLYYTLPSQQFNSAKNETNFGQSVIYLSEDVFVASNGQIDRYVYSPSSATYELSQIIRGATPDFGYAMAMYQMSPGSQTFTLAVSAPTGTNSTGSVYIYTGTPSVGGQAGTLNLSYTINAPGVTGLDAPSFGYSLSLSRNYILIGDPMYNGRTGRAVLYAIMTVNGTITDCLLDETFLPAADLPVIPMTANCPQFGSQVLINTLMKTVIAISAPTYQTQPYPATGTPTCGVGAGAVLMYAAQHNASAPKQTSWVFVEKLTSNDGQSILGFGNSIDIALWQNMLMLAVGAPQLVNTPGLNITEARLTMAYPGMVYVFHMLTNITTTTTGAASTSTVTSATTGASSSAASSTATSTSAPAATLRYQQTTDSEDAAMNAAAAAASSGTTAFSPTTSEMLSSSSSSSTTSATTSATTSPTTSTSSTTSPSYSPWELDGFFSDSNTFFDQFGWTVAWNENFAGGLQLLVGSPELYRNLSKSGKDGTGQVYLYSREVFSGQNYSFWKLSKTFTPNHPTSQSATRGGFGYTIATPSDPEANAFISASPFPTRSEGADVWLFDLGRNAHNFPVGLTTGGAVAVFLLVFGFFAAFMIGVVYLVRKYVLGGSSRILANYDTL